MEKQPILILTHNGWGSELIASLKMIVGSIENVYEVPLYGAETLAEYIEKVKKQIQAVSWNKKLLIFTDIKGGTTSNVALRLSREYDLLIIAGLNAAMLLDAVMKQESEGYTKLMGTEIAKAGIESCGVLEVPVKNNSQESE